MPVLNLVTVPIGNHNDITLRALGILKTISIVLCEDTRVFKNLCKQLGIDYSEKQIISFHDHSSDHNLNGILKLLKSEDCAYVSDAGSPIISDPAYPLVKLCLENQVEVKSVPGVSSLITGLELSGLAPLPFHFHGFLPREEGKIMTEVNTINSLYGTHIYFEGVSRVLKTLEILTTQLPDYDFSVARELTKEYETIHRFRGAEFQTIKNDIVEKGEFVLFVRNDKRSKRSDNDLVEQANEIIKVGAKNKLIAKLLADIVGVNSKDIYNQLNKK